MLPGRHSFAIYPNRGARLADAADRLALAASGACLVHCLALPLLFAAIPALSSVLRVPETFHIWMVALAVPISALALLRSGTLHHGPAPLVLGALGLSLLATGALFPGGTGYDVLLTVAGALVLGAAHTLNWRRRRGCRAC